MGDTVNEQLVDSKKQHLQIPIGIYRRYSAYKGIGQYNGIGNNSCGDSNNRCTAGEISCMQVR